MVKIADDDPQIRMLLSKLLGMLLLMREKGEASAEDIALEIDIEADASKGDR